MIADIATRCGYEECAASLPQTGLSVVDMLLVAGLLIVAGLLLFWIFREPNDA